MLEKLVLLIIGALIGAFLKHNYDKKFKLFEQYQKKKKKDICALFY